MSSNAHKTRDVWEVLETATGARLQSLIFAITTAGFNKEGICYEQRDYAIKLLKILTTRTLYHRKMIAISH
ncbi:terminase (plasmid) [Klebsiella pneumoniae]|nr:terminase [Klebsiella pneumoniae]